MRPGSRSTAGVAFYNTAPIPLDPGFLASRVVIVGAGAGCRGGLEPAFRRNLRGAKPGRRAAPRRAIAGADAPGTVADLATAVPAPLASLGMTMRRPGLLAGAWHVARVELTELRSSPGLYLFIPLILLQTIGDGAGRGRFPRHVAPGHAGRVRGPRRWGP